MHTKFKFKYSKPLQDSYWKQLVNVSTSSVYGRINKLEIQVQFLKFMEDNYGKLDQRYNIRWTDHGVDVRFESYSDAASFIMLHTCKEENDNFRNYPPRIVGH
tara:strand:+ start:721 stop:1029 length:309 start_codon:yes stop_codon:yes gene_type:complete